jgi:Fe-S oxidoreductase
LRLRDAAMAADGRAWADGLEGDAGAATGLIAGCANSDLEVAEARAAFRLLRAGGVPIRALADAPAGGALAALGFTREAAAQRADLDRHLTEAGIAKVAVVGAEFLAHLAAGEAADAPPAESVLETIAAAVAEGRLRLTPCSDNPPPGSVGYLDPCHLTKKAHGLAGRNLGAVARDLLARLGVAVVEPAAAPRFQVCCGAAGGMPDAQPEAAARMARARLDEFGARGAALVVTAGPLCAAHLERSAEAGGPAVRGLYGFLLDHFDAMPGSAQG